MPPLWKIKRELLRPFRQLRNLPRNLFDRYLGTAWYDRVLAKRIRMRRGHEADRPRKAIYLIYPKTGVLPSHIRTLGNLAENGLSVTVVSNLPLSPEDEELLCDHCSSIIVRPNFGLDFGGYRDAILAMADDLSTCEQLVLMNDSVWFPLHEKGDWFADVGALNVDFAGSVSHFGFDRAEPKDFRDFTFHYSTTHKDFHYGSFALSIGPRILKDPDFLSFWRGLRISNDKQKTVRYGETGLTQWVLQRDYTHGDTLGVAGLKGKLSGLNRAQLETLVINIMSFEDPRIKEAHAEVMATLPQLSDEELVKFLVTCGAFQGVGYVLAYFAILGLGYPFLKKSPIRLDKDAAQTSRTLLHELGTPAALEALEETADVGTA